MPSFQPFDDEGFAPNDCTDEEAEQFLKHIHRFVACHHGEVYDDLLSNIVEDLAMSMSPTTDAADWYRQRIEVFLA